MPPLGKPQSNRPRKPFDLAEHNHGEQVNAVRSKIASLMDGVTEGRVPRETTATDSPAVDPAVAPASLEPSAPVAADLWSGSTGVDGSRTILPTNGGMDGGIRDEEKRAGAVELSQNGFYEGGTHAPTGLPTALPKQQQVQFGVDDELESWPRRTAHSAPPTEHVDAAQSHERNARNGWEQPEEPTYPNVPAAAGTGNASWRETGARDVDFDRAHEQHSVHANIPAQENLPRTDKSSQEAKAAQPATSGAINIKGRSGGILIEIGNGQWPDLMVALAERLTGAANFFRNGNAAIDLAARPLIEPELGQLRTLLQEQALELVLIRTSSPETFQVALEMGLAAQLETMEGETTATAQPALSNLLQEHHFVYSGHLRAGQVLQRNEHILVIGDVNPGATVISNGDILVWGHLRGVAHAGAGGDSRAVICALDLTPVQIRISDLIAIAPEPEKPKRSWGRKQAPVKQPEVAYIAGDRINVEPWDATKFGGIATFRRQ